MYKKTDRFDIELLDIVFEFYVKTTLKKIAP